MFQEASLSCLASGLSLKYYTVCLLYSFESSLITIQTWNGKLKKKKKIPKIKYVLQLEIATKEKLNLTSCNLNIHIALNSFLGCFNFPWDLGLLFPTSPRPAPSPLVLRLSFPREVFQTILSLLPSKAWSSFLFSLYFSTPFKFIYLIDSVSWIYDYDDIISLHLQYHLWHKCKWKKKDLALFSGIGFLLWEIF